MTPTAGCVTMAETYSAATSARECSTWTAAISTSLRMMKTTSGCAPCARSVAMDMVQGFIGIFINVLFFSFSFPAEYCS